MSNRDWRRSLKANHPLVVVANENMMIMSTGDQYVSLMSNDFENVPHDSVLL